MSRCPFHDRLEPYLADGLGDSDQAILVAHISDCQNCQRELETLTEPERTSARAPSSVGNTDTTQTLPREAFLERLKQLTVEAGIARPVVAGQPPHFEGYEIEVELGRGGMGVVYKARQVSLNRLVALKMILGGGFRSPTGRERFLAEAAVVAQMQHPNIVQIFECGTHEDQLYFSMELCEGGSLAQRLRSGPLSPREAAALVQSVAEGAQAAHDQGIIHRDLSPGNILLAGGGREPHEGERSAASPRPLAEFIPKISDFGVARQTNTGLTGSGVALGTPRYMAPEQTVDSRAIDHRADIYSLGAILYECLAGRPPFQAATVLDMLDQVRHREPIPVRQLQPSVPRDLETICLKCLSKEPQQRYATARELADDLGRFLQGKPIRARPSSLPERFARWCQRPERVPFAGKLAILVHGALAVWKLVAVVLIGFAIGIVPRDVGECVVQILATIAILTVPQIGIGFAVLARWPPAIWTGTVFAMLHLAFWSACFGRSFLTFGGLLDDPNLRWLLFCILIIPACFTLFAYVVALIAQCACGHDIR